MLVLAEQFRFAEAKHLQGCAVDEGATAGEIHAEYALAQGVEELSALFRQAMFLFPQLGLSAHELDEQHENEQRGNRHDRDDRTMATQNIRQGEIRYLIEWRQAQGVQHVTHRFVVGRCRPAMVLPLPCRRMVRAQG
jgi:hypothetical protein